MWFGYEVKTGLNRLLSNVRMQERSCYNIVKKIDLRMS